VFAAFEVLLQQFRTVKDAIEAFKLADIITIIHKNTFVDLNI